MKITTGRPGRLGINEAEPQPASGIPTPPDHLGDEARRAWFAWCPILDAMGVLTTADGMALERLCECYAEVVELQIDLRKGGRVQVVKTKSKAKFERQRPQVAMLADADRRLKSYLVEFGLSPAARNKVNVVERPKADPVDKYFK